MSCFFSWSLLCLSHVFNWMIFNAVIWNTTIPQHQVVFDSQLSWDVEVWLELCGVRMPGQRVRQTETELRWRRTDELIGCDRSSVLLHCSTKCPKWKSIWHNAGSRPSWSGRDEWTVETLAKLTLLQQYACKQSWYSCDDMMLTIKTPSWGCHHWSLCHHWFAFLFTQRVKCSVVKTLVQHVAAADSAYFSSSKLAGLF